MILQSPEDSTKISSLYTCVPKITITWFMVPDLGNFLPFYHPLPPPYIDPRNQIFDKKWKKCLEILSFYTYMSTIMKIYDIWFLKYKVQQTEIFTILEHFFCPFRPLTSWKIKILPLRKNAWRYHFTHVYQKRQSHHEWFLRYQAQPT